MFAGVPDAWLGVIKFTPRHSRSVKFPAVTRAKVFCHGGNCVKNCLGFLPEGAACPLHETHGLPAMDAKFFHSEAW